MTTERLNQLAQEISTWSARNFPVRESRLGIIEEIGEAAHCLLKRRQGIRGFENHEYFKEQLADALADTAIYALDYAGYKGLEIEAGLSPTNMQADEIRVMSLLSQAASVIASGWVKNEGPQIEQIFTCLSYMGNIHGIDFHAKLEDTWAKVSKRDWVVNPTNANVIAEAGSHV